MQKLERAGENVQNQGQAQFSCSAVHVMDMYWQCSSYISEKQKPAKAVESRYNGITLQPRAANIAG